MQRIMIAPPAEVFERIRNIAAGERRTPRQQIEHILIEHVREQGNASEREVTKQATNA